MRRFRQTLRKSRIFFLSFLLVETFFLVDGQQFVYACQLRERQAEMELESLAATFGIPVERLRGEEQPLFEPLTRFLAKEIGPLASSGLSRVESLIVELAGDLDNIFTPPRAQLAAGSGQTGSGQTGSGQTASPQERQESEHGASASRRESFEERWKDSQLPPVSAADKERSGPTLRLPEGKPLPLRRVEKKARTEKGRATEARVKVSARAPASAPRQSVSKSGIAPEITALAESLGNSPARIFRLVHDSIDFDPQWGAGKPPLGTLWEGAGTSWDQAWLLRDLLTAAGVDARFEWGEVEITTEMLVNITGVDDPFRAGDLMATAGVPIVLIVEGSQVVAARMSHVWIKAHLDYIPNRGVTPGPGDTWIRMDPSLKRFEVAGGLRLDEEVPFDLGEYLESGTVFAPRLVYEEALAAYIADHSLGVTLEEVKRSKTILEEAFPFVPGTLRGKILTVAGESTEIPEAYQQQLELQVREAGGPVLLTWSTPWPAVYGERLELAWPGATSADQTTLDLYGGVFATPPYEVDLKPVLRLEGAEVASGGPIGSAEDVELVATIMPPEGSATVAQFGMLAGEHAVLAVDFARMPQEVVDRYAEERDAASNAHEEEAWTLALAGAHYLRSLGGDLKRLGALRWRRVVKLGNVVLTVQRGAVSRSPDGTPLTFSAAPPSIDLGSMVLGLFPPDGVAPSTASAVGTLELLGSESSFLEGETWYQVIGGEQVTAVGFLTRAVREGQTLTRVEAGNLDAALAAAELSDQAEASVRAAVERGLVAWISESQLPVDTWETTGYVLEDPETGGAGYFVTFERLVPGLEATIEFHSPQDLDEMTAPIDVVATLEGEGIASWTLSYQFAGEGQPVVLATGTRSVRNATLAQFDPTLLLNGLYDLVLTARNAAGQAASEKISVVVEGGMKIGNFTLSFNDLTVPLVGLNIEIVRTYDSRERDQGGVQNDFGYGWSLDIRHGSYRNNRKPGAGWQILNPGGPFGLPCTVVTEVKSHLTTVRLSDQEVYRFRLGVVDAAPTGGGCEARAVFAFVDGPLPGTTLEIVGNDTVFWENGTDDLIDVETFQVYEPTEVKLTTRDGRIFELNLVDGVTSVEDLSSNRIEITSAGIIHSSGVSIDFVRNAEGRITKIIDPRGGEIAYAYTPAGDLDAFTDRVGNTTHFFYSSQLPHLLEDIEDSRGVRPIRNDYDQDGRLLRHTDAFGKVIEFSHDLDNRREVITNRLGHSRTLEYNIRGNVIRETDEVGGVTERTFDLEDNLLTETDPLDRTTTYTYSDRNDLLTLTDPLGRTTTYTYDPQGRILSVTDPKGHVTSNTYDFHGRLERTTDALGQITTFTVYANGSLHTITDELGQTAEFTYNLRGDQITEADALGNITTFTCDSNGNRLTETRTRTLPDSTTESLVTTFAYDEMDRLIRTTAPDGSTTSSTYDSLGKVLDRTDALGRVTTMTYDLMGRLATTTFPDSTTESQTYDAEGRVLTQTDRQGRITTFAYDAAGRLLTTTYADGATLAQVYDLAGQLTTTTDARGKTTTYVYDDAGRRTSVVNALAQRTSFVYDQNGNQSSVTDARGKTTTFAYDALDRLVTTTLPDATTTSVAYDVRGRRIRETDQAGLITQFGYDDLGRLISVTDPLSQVTSYTYDEVGNRLTQTDANGHTTTFEYDSLGRQVARIFPDAGPGNDRESMAYNVDGTLASHTDFAGQTRTFDYDINQRLVRRAYPDGSEDLFTYSATGQRETSVDPRGITTYAYDVRDRLLEKVDPTGHRLTYGYDLQGNLTDLTATVGVSSYQTTYTYDDLNRLETITDPQGQVNSQTYDANGNRVGLEHANGLSTAYTYDDLNRLTLLRTRDAGGDVVQGYAYTLAPTGHRTRIDEADGTARSYTYDDLYRLTQDRVTVAGGGLLYQRDFGYDPVGNRLSQTVDSGSGPAVVASSYDDRDRLQEAGTSTYAWDDNGNLSDRDTEVLEWDFDQRLAAITLADGTVVEPVYDVDGNRVQTNVTPVGGAMVTVDYLVDTRGFLSHVVAEVMAGVVDTVYVRSNDELVSLWRPLVGESRWFLVDGLGSVRGLVDATGVVTDSYSYTAFGELLERAGSDAQPYQFAGEMFDPNSRFYYNRARWLDPGAGRFVSVDPLWGNISEPATLHKYGYAGSDPVNNVDPSGLLFTITAALASIGFAALFLVSCGAPREAIETPRFQLLGDDVVKDPSRGFFKDFWLEIQAATDTPEQTQRYLVVQWLRGELVVNGRFGTTMSHGSRVESYFPNWVIDSPDAGRASIRLGGPFLNVSDAGFLFHDTPGLNLEYGSRLRPGAHYRVDLDFKVNVYDSKFTPDRISSFRTPWDPRPLATYNWSFRDSWTVP